MMKKAYLAGCVLMAMLGAQADRAGVAAVRDDERRTYAAHILMTEPALDRKTADEPAWENISDTGGFVERGRREAAVKQTLFRAGYTFEALYFSVRCMDPEVLDAALEDWVEIYLALAGENTYFRFRIDATRSKDSELYENIPGLTDDPPSPLGRLPDISVPVDAWEAAVSKGEDCWYVGIKIPFSVLGRLPEENETWLLNIVRNIPAEPHGQSTSWSPLLRLWSHEPPHFGEIVFKETIAPDLRAEIEGRSPDHLVYVKPNAGIYHDRGAGEHRRINYSQAAYVSPRFSPDREKILYHSMEGGELGIRLMGVDGSGSEFVCTGAYATWSPCGNKLAFQRNGALWEREIETGRETRLTPRDWNNCNYPVYLNDGEVVFIASRKGRAGIYSMEPVPGGTPRLLLTARYSLESGVAPSPDGSLLAYQDGAHIYLYDGTRSRRLTTTGGVQSWPVWSRDGLGVRYLQSPETAGPSFDLYYTSIAAPERVGLIMRDIYPSFDWDGEAPWNGINWIELKTAPHAIHTRTEDGWTLGNARINLHVSRDDNRILLRTEHAQEALDLLVLDDRGAHAASVRNVVMRDNGADEGVSAELSWLSQDGQVMEALLTVPKHDAFMKLEPVRNVSAAALAGDLAALVLPDRFANDLTLMPAHDLPSTAALPHVPFAAGLRASGDRGMLLVITPARNQALALRRADNGSVFDKLTVTFAGEPAYVSLLDGDHLWFQKELEPGDVIQWSQPFQAYWRFTSAESGGYSRMWCGAELAGLDKPEIPWEEDFEDTTRQVLIYLYGRDQHTPLNIVTPMDVLHSALGVEGTGSLLDIEGIRGYRVANEWVPWAIYRWTLTGGRPADRRNFAQGRGLRLEAEGAYLLALVFQEDVLAILRGMDDRIGEYRDFLLSLPDSNDAAVTEESKRLAAMTSPETEDLRLSEENIRGRTGRVGFLYRGAVREAVEAKSAALREYREFVKNLRDTATLGLIEEPGNALYEDLRVRTALVLRNRHYLEDDWRGERPLDMEEMTL